MKICIDPGHGGVDPGAVGPTGLKEKDVNLAVAKQVADLLRPVCDIVMTRTTDVRLGSTVNADLKARVRIAEQARADYFISMHCNSFNDRTAHGIETWAYAPGGNGEKMAKAIQAELVKATGLTDRGVKFSGSSMYVLRYTTMPAVLAEMGFISNPSEEKLLRDPSFQSKLAKAIAQGVVGHLGLKLPEPKPTPQPTSGKLYRVQIGAYAVKANADAQLARAKKAGFNDAFIATAGKLYRVQVGAYAVKANAETQLAKAKTAGFSDAFMVS